MADLGDIGKQAWLRFPQYGGNGFTVIRSGGMIVEIDPAPTNAILNLTRNGVQVDRRRESGGTVEFYDLEPGNWIASSVFGGGTGTTWAIVVTPSSYTVTRLTSPTVPGFVYFG